MGIDFTFTSALTHLLSYENLVSSPNYMTSLPETTNFLPFLDSPIKTPLLTWESTVFVYNSLYQTIDSPSIIFQDFSWEGESTSYYLIDFIPLTAFNVYGTLLTAKNVVLRAGLEVEPVLDPTSLMYIDPLFMVFS